MSLLWLRQHFSKQWRVFLGLCQSHPALEEQGFWASVLRGPVQAASLLRAFSPWLPSWQHCSLELPRSPAHLLPQGRGKCSFHCSL